MVRLSIIVPVYNKVRYIDECIQSILAQTFTDYELILVNDGSTDGSAEKCRQYAQGDSRIVMIEQKNSGVSSARNAGMKMAKGTYIGFVDSDDTIAADMYSTLLQNALETGATISSCRVCTIKNGKADRIAGSSGKVRFDHIPALQAFFQGRFDFNVNNKIYHTAMLDQLSFKGAMYEDILFVCKAFLKADLSILENEAKYNYIIRDNSVSMGSFGAKYFETAAVSAEMTALIEKHAPECLPEAKAFDVMVNLSLLNLLRLLKDKRPFEKEYRKIVARLDQYNDLIRQSEAVRKKHKLAWKLFSASPRLYTGAMRIVCLLTQSDAIKRTRKQ